MTASYRNRSRSQHGKRNAVNFNNNLQVLSFSEVGAKTDALLFSIHYQYCYYNSSDCYLNAKSQQNDSPKPLKIVQKAIIILHTLGFRYWRIGDQPGHR